MKRHMPKTFDYLTNELEAIDLMGYTKIGANTIPNIFGLLSGFSQTELSEMDCPHDKVFDNCTFLWDLFSENNYTTIFSEDALWMGLFRYVHRGYVNEPTDYYLHPFYLLSEKYIGHYELSGKSHQSICQGDKMAIDVMYDFAIEASRSLKDVPHFGFFESAGLAHDILKYSAACDDPSYNALKKLNLSGALNNTILFFISDHGLRFGKITSTNIGYYEGRLPYHMIVFPKWFRKVYPTIWKNLQTNQERLTCPFDIHQTIKDILYQRFYEDDSPREGHGRSLFLGLCI